MRSFLILASVFFVSTSFASTIRTVKLMDGTKAYCRNKYDFHRYKVGAYRLMGKAVSIKENRLNINTNIGFLECSKNDNGNFAFRSVSPTHTYTYTIINKDKERETVKVITDKVVLRTYVPARFRRRGAKVNPTDTAINSDYSRTGLNIDMGLRNMLTEEQVESLESGKAVKTVVNAFLSKDVTYLRENGDTWKDNIAFGSFRFFIEVKEDEKGIRRARLVK